MALMYDLNAVFYVCLSVFSHVPRSQNEKKLKVALFIRVSGEEGRCAFG